MAFKKEIELENGIVVPYWKITHFQVDTFAKVVDVNVHGWLSKEDADAGKAPIALLPGQAAIRLVEADWKSWIESTKQKYSGDFRNYLSYQNLYNVIAHKQHDTVWQKQDNGEPKGSEKYQELPGIKIADPSVLHGAAKA